MDLTLICRACLSGGRKLVKLNRLRDIIEDIHLYELKNLTGSVCWECRNKMVEFYKFKKNVCFALNILGKIDKKDRDSITLSCLTTITNTESYFKEQNNENKNNKILQSDKIDAKTIASDIVGATHYLKEEIKLEIDNVMNTYYSEVTSNDVDSENSNDEIVLEVDTDIKSDCSGDTIPDEIDPQNDMEIEDVTECLQNDTETVTNYLDDTIVENNLKQTKEIKTFKNTGKNIIVNNVKHKVMTVRLKRKELEERRVKLMSKLNESYFRFQCVSCILGFDDEVTFDNHFLKYHNESLGSYFCEVCCRRFQSEMQMWLHFSDHFKYYKCKLCDYENDVLPKVTSHYSDTHCEKPKEVEEPKRKYKCKECDATFLTYEQMARHRRRHRPPQYECDLCDKKYYHYSDMSHHFKQKHEDLPKLQCGICNKYYAGKISLKSHMKSVHINITQNAAAFCGDCKKQFKTIHQFREHIKRSIKHMNADARLQCDLCSNSFSLKASLIEHINNIHGTVKETCQLCDKKFNTEKKLKRHIAEKHTTSDKIRDRHVCSLCGNTYKHASSLREHMNTHSNSRPYACPLCAARFNHSGALFTHKVMVHKISKKKQQ